MSPLTAPQPCRARAAALGGLGGVTAGARRQRREIVDICHDVALELRRRQRLLDRPAGRDSGSAGAAPAFVPEWSGE